MRKTTEYELVHETCFIKLHYRWLKRAIVLNFNMELNNLEKNKMTSLLEDYGGANHHSHARDIVKEWFLLQLSIKCYGC